MVLALRTRWIADATRIRRQWGCRWQRLSRCLRWCCTGGRWRYLSRGGLGGNADGRAGDDHFDAAVLLATSSGTVIRHRIAHAVPDCADVLCRNALRDEEI